MSTRYGSSILALAALLWGCSDGTSAAPMAGATSATSARATAAEPPAQPPRPPAAESSLGGRLFTDVSGSMRGFTSRGRASVANVHQALADTFAEVGLPSPLRCTVGEAIDCERAPSRPADYAVASTYVAGQSRLDEVLRERPLPERIDPDHPPAPDLLDDARLTVVVTDGMQAASGGPGGGSASTACQAGADPSCLTAILGKRAEAGYGLWLVQVSLAFSGKHFAERPLGATFLPRIQAHLEEANLAPRWNGIEFALKTGIVPDGASGNSAYVYEGFKPLLVLVASRQVEQGRRFVEGLVRRLRAEPIHPGQMSPDDAVVSVELSPLSPASYRLTAVELAPREDQTGISTAALAELRVERSQPSPAGVEASVWCGANGAALLYARYERAAGPVPLPGFASQDLDLAGPRRDRGLPDRAAAPAIARPSSSTFRIGVNCAVLPAGRSEIEYELRTQLRLDEQRAAGEWWSELSADNTWETPERLYGLRDLVMGVLRTRATGARACGRVAIVVTRE